MIKDRINKLFSLKKATVIFINILPDNKMVYDLAILEIKNGKIDIKQKETNLDFEDVVKLSGNKSALFLNIDGSGVLHKKNTQHTNIDNIHQIFPNINKDDFYFQLYQPEETAGYVTLIRKNVLDHVYESFKQKNHFILDISLGPFSCYSIKNLLNNEDVEQLQTTLYNFNLQTNDIKPVKPADQNKKTYYIDDVAISASLMPVFACVIMYISGENTILLKDENIISDEVDYRYFNYFKIAGTAILSIIFLILLINYMYFNKYQENLNGLSVETNRNMQNINKIEELNNAISLAEKIINNTGISSQTKFSFYCDRIAMLLPYNIILDELWAQPLQGKIKTDKEIIYNRNKISVSGYTTKSTLLNQFMQNLEEEKWIDDVSIIDYSFDNTNNRALFKIEISVK